LVQPEWRKHNVKSSSNHKTHRVVMISDLCFLSLQPDTSLHCGTLIWG